MSCLSSPLLGTVAVAVALTLIAIPLRRVTSAAEDVAGVQLQVESAESGKVWVSLKLLAGAQRVVLRSLPPASEILWELEDVAAGEYEEEILIERVDGVIDVDVAVYGSRVVGETAVFLTVMPDALPDRAAYLVGDGDFGGVLSFEWPDSD